MAKTALIIGSTGLVGSQLLQQLLASPCYTKVVSLSRRQLDFSHPKLTSHVIDFENLTHSQQSVVYDWSNIVSIT